MRDWINKQLKKMEQSQAKYLPKDYDYANRCGRGDVQCTAARQVAYRDGLSFHFEEWFEKYKDENINQAKDIGGILLIHRKWMKRLEKDLKQLKRKNTLLMGWVNASIEQLESMDDDENEEVLESLISLKEQVNNVTS